MGDEAEPWLWDKVQQVKQQRSGSKTKYNSKPFLFKKLRAIHVATQLPLMAPSITV
jgi:hypothetical protein